MKCRYWQVLATLLAIGCAGSGPREPELTPRAIRDATQCVKNFDACFIVHVSNDQFYRAVVKLNGVKIGEVEGNRSEAIAVPDTRLRNGRCAKIEVYLIGPSSRGMSDQQCIRHGGWFTFEIDNQNHLWLTPWGGA